MIEANKIKQFLIASKTEAEDCFLFDWKTAPYHKPLKYKVILIALKVSENFNLCQLLPKRQQLNRK